MAKYMAHLTESFYYISDVFEFTVFYTVIDRDVIIFLVMYYFHLIIWKFHSNFSSNALEGFNWRFDSSVNIPVARTDANFS